MGRRGSKRGLPKLLKHIIAGKGTLCGKMSFKTVVRESEATCPKCRELWEALKAVAPDEERW